MKSITYKHLEDLELELFKDLSNFKDITFESHDFDYFFNRVIGYIDKCILLLTDYRQHEYILISDIKDNLNFKSGDIVYVNNNVESDDECRITKIENDETAKEIFDLNEKFEMSKYNFEDEVLDYIPEEITEITKQNFEEVVKLAQKRKEKKDEEEQKRRNKRDEMEKEQRRKEELQNKELQDYKNIGDYENEYGVKVHNNILSVGNQFSLTLNSGMIKDYFIFEHIEEIENCFGSSYFNRAIIKPLLDKQISFEIINGKAKISFKFEGKKLFLNDISIPPHSAIRCYEWKMSEKPISDDNLKEFSRLTNVKIKVLTELNEIYLNIGKKRLEIPIIVNFIDKDNMELEILNRKKTFDWKTIRNTFVRGISYIDNHLSNRLFEFFKEFGFSKQELFDELKTLMSLKEL